MWVILRNSSWPYFYKILVVKPSLALLKKTSINLNPLLQLQKDISLQWGPTEPTLLSPHHQKHQVRIEGLRSKWYLANPTTLGRIPTFRVQGVRLGRSFHQPLQGNSSWRLLLNPNWSWTNEIPTLVESWDTWPQLIPDLPAEPPLREEEPVQDILDKTQPPNILPEEEV